MIDPAKQLYDAFFDWIATRNYGIPVIERRPNAPGLKGHHLVLDTTPSSRPVGTVAKGYRDAEDYQSLVLQFRGEVALWEIGASNTYLHQILVDLELQSSVQFFEARKVSILKPGEITAIPDLLDELYQEQFRLPFQVAVAGGQVDTALSYIEGVSFDNQVVRSI